MYLPAIFVTQTFGKSKDPDPQLVAAFGSLLQPGRMFNRMPMYWANSRPMNNDKNQGEV